MHQTKELGSIFIGLCKCIFRRPWNKWDSLYFFSCKPGSLCGSPDGKCIPVPVKRIVSAWKFSSMNECYEASLDNGKLSSVAAYKPFMMTGSHPLLMKCHDHTCHKLGQVGSRDTCISAGFTILQKRLRIIFHIVFFKVTIYDNLRRLCG